MGPVVTELWPLVLGAGAATYLWRGLGVALSGRIPTDGPAFEWVGCVAYAMIAGLTMRVILMPTGTLARTALEHRLLACAVALFVYFVLSRRNLFIGVISGLAAMVFLHGVFRVT